MFETKIVEQLETHVLGSKLLLFFRESCRLCDIEEEHCRAGQATEHMVHAGHLRLKIHTQVV